MMGPVKFHTSEYYHTIWGGTTAMYAETQESLSSLPAVIMTLLA